MLPETAAVPNACKELMEAEDIVLNYVKGSNPNLTADGLDAARKECSAVIGKLSKRMRGE